MPLPGRPAPHFILIQAHFSLGRLKAALDGPAAPSHPHDLLQGRRVRGKHHLGGQLRGSAPTAPDQPPAAPAGHQRCSQGQPAPVIPAGAFRGCLKSLGCREPPQHQTRHREVHHGLTALGQSFIVLAQAARLMKPRQCSFYHPPARPEDKTFAPVWT